VTNIGFRMAPFQLRFVLPIITKTNKSGEHLGEKEFDVQQDLC